MAWARRYHRDYYYRSRRVNGRVIKEYIGRGPVAEQVAAHDADQRVRRAVARDAWWYQRAAMEALDAQVTTWWDHSTALVKMVLPAEGYYRHDRGSWRKRRSSA